jgi:hypothetical protein
MDRRAAAFLAGMAAMGAMVTSQRGDLTAAYICAVLSVILLLFSIRRI